MIQKFNKQKESEMKKITLFGLIGIMSVGSANAGWFDSLFGIKEKEPATLEEACNRDELTEICPEILLGGMTLAECLKSNVGKLSDKCAGFVKKNTVAKIDDTKKLIADKTEATKALAVNDKGESIKAETKAKVDSVKAETKAKVDAVKADTEAKKAAAKATADEAKANSKEINDAAKQTGSDLKETGKSLKSLF